MKGAKKPGPIPSYVRKTTRKSVNTQYNVSFDLSNIHEAMENMKVMEKHDPSLGDTELNAIMRHPPASKRRQLQYATWKELLAADKAFIEAMKAAKGKKASTWPKE